MQTNNYSNIPAEKALIAAVIIDSTNMQEASILTPSDFYDSRHRAIFTLMKELYTVGKSIDLISFAGTEYEDYVLRLMELPQGLLNVKNYISDIKENSLKRQRITLIDDFKNNKIDYEDLINSLQKLYIAKKEIIKATDITSNLKH